MNKNVGYVSLGVFVLAVIAVFGVVFALYQREPIYDSKSFVEYDPFNEGKDNNDSDMKLYRNIDFGIDFAYPPTTKVGYNEMPDGSQIEIGGDIAKIIIRKNDLEGNDVIGSIEKYLSKSQIEMLERVKLNDYDAYLLRAEGKYPLEYDSVYVQYDKWVYSFLINNEAECFNNPTGVNICNDIEDNLYNIVLLSIQMVPIDELTIEYKIDENQPKMVSAYKLPNNWSVDIESNHQLTVISSIKEVKFHVGVLSGPGIWGCETESVETKVGEWTKKVVYNSTEQTDSSCSTENFAIFIIYENMPVTIIAEILDLKYVKDDARLNTVLKEADEFVKSLKINSEYYN